jgi:hypothetical protein
LNQIKKNSWNSGGPTIPEAKKNSLYAKIELRKFVDNSIFSAVFCAYSSALPKTVMAQPADAKHGPL